MEYKSLEITNFRSIHSLKADDFKRVNLITGRNNCGKTTLLEALFLISGMSNPYLPIVINNFRGLEVAEDNAFNTIFYNLDFANCPVIRAGVNNHYRELVINAAYTDPFKVDQRVEIFDTSADPLPNGLSFAFSETGRKYVSEISIRDKKLIKPPDYKEALFCAYYNTKLSSTLLYKKVEKIIINKKLNDAISVLRQIDGRICDIRMGLNNSLFIDVGQKELMPLNTMGDGVIRLLSIVAGLYECENGILLIDEIENGFHFRTLEILWKAVFTYAVDYNVQIFATTHSWECVAAMNGIMNDMNLDDVLLFRLDKKDGRHELVKYERELINAGIEGNYEFR